jgi:hypothetical protein
MFFFFGFKSSLNLVKKKKKNTSPLIKGGKYPTFSKNKVV